MELNSNIVKVEESKSRKKCPHCGKYVTYVKHKVYIDKAVLGRIKDIFNTILEGMSPNPPRRCPECASSNLEPIYWATENKDVGWTCLACGYKFLDFDKMQMGDLK